MSTPQLKFLSQQTLVFNYLPATLKQNKSGWCIEYSCEDPNDGKMHRKRLGVQKIRKRYTRKSEALAHIYKIINEINLKLAKGWNPFITIDNVRQYSSVKEVTDRFISEKQRELRPDTMRSYRSYVRMFLEYVETRAFDIKYIISFTREWAVRFMDYVYDERKVSQRSYNNYRRFFVVLFNWAIEKNYITDNPFLSIKSKAKQPKKRGIIDQETRKNIMEHLKNENPCFMVACKLMYYCLIRPKEILMLKVGDVNFERKTIYISGSTAKNRHERHAAMTQDVIDSLQYIKRYRKDMYLISKELFPSYEKASNTKLGKIWTRVRRDMKLPSEMQLYSFRDTGIYEMLKCGIDPLTVKQHADHHSLAMTTIYSDHEDPNLTNIIYKSAPEF